MLGIYTITISVLMIFVTLLTSGIPFTISKMVSANKNINKTESSKIVTTGLIITCSIAIITSILIVIFRNVFDLIFEDSNSYILLLSLIPVILTTGIYSPIKGYFWGKENYIKVSLVELIEQVARIISYFILLKFFTDELLLLPSGISLSIAGIISVFVGILLYFKDKLRLKFTKTYFKPIVKSSLPLITIRLISSIISPLISVVLPLMLIMIGYTKNQALSELGIIMGMSLPILTIPSTILSSLSFALVPKLSNAITENKKTEFSNQLKSSLKLTNCIIFLFIPIFLSLSSPICKFMFNNSSAGNYILYSTWAMVPMSLSGLTTSIINAMGLEKKSLIYFIYSGIVIFICILIFPKFLGINTLILALGLSSLLICILNIRKIKSVIPGNLELKSTLIKLSITIIPCTLITFFIYNLTIKIFSNFLALSLSCIISVISYAIFLYLFNIINLEIVNSFFKKKKTKKQKV